MIHTEDSSQSPDVPHLLEALNSAGLRYVLIGSVAAQLYGIETQPGDLDIIPEWTSS
jgi:hypothetical protein